MQRKRVRVRRELIALGYGTLLLVAASCAGETPDETEGIEPPFVARPVTDQPGARRFVELATPGQVPAVAEQATSRGRSLGALATFGSRVFLGYGDYSENTGPIASVSWSSSDNSFEVGQVLSTEELLEFETHAGYLFAADLDPRGHEALGSVFRLANASGDWQKMTDIPQAVHTFGMTEFQGRLFAGTGSVLGETARVVSSSDAGESWQDEHTTLSPAQGFSRYTHLAATDSRLIVSGRFHETPEAAFAYTLEAGQWQRVAGVPANGFLIPLALGEQLLVAQFNADKGKGGQHLMTFVLEGDSLIPTDMLPAGESLVNWRFSSDPRNTFGEDPPSATEDLLWILSQRADQSQAVHIASALNSWELIAELPPLPDADRFSALSYLDDNLYLGTTHGGFYRIEEVFELAN